MLKVSYPPKILVPFELVTASSESPRPGWTGVIQETLLNFFPLYVQVWGPGTTASLPIVKAPCFLLGRETRSGPVSLPPVSGLPFFHLRARADSFVHTLDGLTLLAGLSMVTAP